MVSNNERHRFYALNKSLLRLLLLLGRKTPTEEYLTRIRTARNTDGRKRFKTISIFETQPGENSILKIILSVCLLL